MLTQSDSHRRVNNRNSAGFHPIVLIFVFLGQAFATTQGSGKSGTWYLRSRNLQVIPDQPELITCINNMEAGDGDSDLRLDRNEFGEFVRIQSLGRIDDPLMNLPFVTIFYSEACTQCIDLVGSSNCCIGGRANIVISEEFLGREQYLETIEYVCGTVNEQIEQQFPPTVAPASGEPSISPPATLSPLPAPSSMPSPAPSPLPTLAPTPTQTSMNPSHSPTSPPSPAQTQSPSSRPTLDQSDAPTSPPSSPPSADPVAQPSERPSSLPTLQPVPVPSSSPTNAPFTPAPTTANPTASARPTSVETVAEFEFSIGTDPNSGDVALVNNNLVMGLPGLSNGTGLVQTAQIDGSAPIIIEESEALKFGSSVDLSVLSGEFSLLVGAPDTMEANGTKMFGSAEYFSFDGQEWTRLGSPLVPPRSVDLDEDGQFGFAVAMATTIRRLVIGAPFSRTVVANIELESGKLYTFEFDGTDWREMAEPQTGQFFAQVGFSVDMARDGSRFLAGAPAFEGLDGGATYYQWNPETAFWDPIFSIRGDNSEQAGTSVAIITEGSETIAIGSPAFGNDQGRVRVFVQFNDEFVPLGSAIEGFQNERIGTTLSGSRGRIAFGTATNFVRVYQFSATIWVEVISVEVPRPIVSVALADDGTSVAVGMEGNFIQVYAFVV